MSTPLVKASSPQGVIHDIGYRPYSGVRRSEARVAGSLLASSVANAFGWGRSMRSKSLPLFLLALYVLPAPLSVAVAGLTSEAGTKRLPISYTEYASSISMLLTVFAAVQAPVLFSRDQRFGTISLYLSRPLRSFTYAFIRWAGLALSLLIMIVLPLVVLLIGALLTGFKAEEQFAGFTQGIVFGILLALLLASVTAVISAWSTRRGFGVVISVTVLLVGSGIVSIIQELANEENLRVLGRLAAAFSPLGLYQGLVTSFTDENLSHLDHPGGARYGLLYLAVSLLIVGGSLLLLRLHYRKVASR